MPGDPRSLTLKRFIFPKLLGKLLTFADANALYLMMGECYRTPEQAAHNALHGIGIVNSLHRERLAVDVLLYRQTAPGVWLYLTSGDEPEYKVLGDYWKTLDPEARWGGDFLHMRDAGHFSLAYGGRA